MSVPRPLPARPSLEFERKRAKALLRRWRTDAAHADIVRTGTANADTKLSDAQRVIAREYGFSSWPSLVRYFADAERIAHRTPCAVNPGRHRPESYHERVQQLIVQHRKRVPSVALALITTVPRFYGLPVDQAMALDITDDEARLAVARAQAFASWDVFIAHVSSAHTHPMRQSTLERAPLRQAIDALRDADLARLQDIVRAHPELLTPSDYEVATCMHLMRFALEWDRSRREKEGDSSRMEPILRWLTSVGFDVQTELNILLCGDHRMAADDVRYWITRGANPEWVAPNGYSVLEHAIVRYQNPNALDTLAQYASVRTPAPWIAAGLGDLAGLARFFDARGRPTAAARRHHPLFETLGTRGMSRALQQDDEQLLADVAMVAFMNRRPEVVTYLVERGFPVNSLRFDMPLVVMAVGDNMVEMVEALVRAGADIDLRGAYNGSAREMARSMLEGQPQDPGRRRIAALCGVDADAVIAERDARPPSTPVPSARLTQVLALATDDARRLGHTSVSVEHLLFGLLRSGFPSVEALVDHSGVDRDAFRDHVAERVRVGEEIREGAPLPFSAEVQDALDAAVALAADKRRTSVSPQHLLLALLQREHDVLQQTITRFGGSVQSVRAYLEAMH